jgi:DNA polymerase-3 subunit alpha
MGRNKKEVLDKMKPKFVEQAAAKGHDFRENMERLGRPLQVMPTHSIRYAWIVPNPYPAISRRIYGCSTF